MAEKILPKPQTDLPLPEKEIPAHLASKGVPFRSYKKFLVLGISTILLLSIIGGAYLLGRNSVFKELNPTVPVIPPAAPVIYDPTVDWKTHEEEGFSFKLPPSWTSTQESGRSNLSLIFKESDNSERFIRVSKSDGPIEKYLKEGGGDAGLAFSAKHEKDTFGNKNIVRSTITYSQFDPKTEKYEIDDYGYEILIDSGSDIYMIYGNLEDKDFVNQILSTFKFTESAELVTQTPTGKPQTNGANWDKIKYTLPSGWTTDNRGDVYISGNDSGYISIQVFDYNDLTGRREFYCKLEIAYCPKNANFTSTSIGNISGYRIKNETDNQNATDYFGSKGNKFYVVRVVLPGTENNINYQSVLNSLQF